MENFPSNTKSLAASLSAIEGPTDFERPILACSIRACKSLSSTRPCDRVAPAQYGYRGRFPANASRRSAERYDSSQPCEFQHARLRSSQLFANCFLEHDDVVSHLTGGQPIVCRLETHIARPRNGSHFDISVPKQTVDKRGHFYQLDRAGESPAPVQGAVEGAHANVPARP